MVHMPNRPDGPRLPRSYLLLLGLVAIAIVPFAFIPGTTGSWLGLPLWLWSSLTFTVLLSVLVAWGILRLWRDDPRE